MPRYRWSIFNLAVLVGALGYFVDIYDLVLFGIVRKASLMGIGITDPEAIFRVGENLISIQMIGMLTGGIVWGVLGDKRGRLQVLFGSIALYSVGNFLNAFITTVPQYALLRFITGFGLAGELGAAITLVSEVLPKENRGYGTALVAGIGVSGAIAANLVAHILSWRWVYATGGILGFLLLIMRIGVAESGMFRHTQGTTVKRGNLFMLFNDRQRFFRYLLCLLVGLPIWFMAGILVNFSPEYAQGQGAVEPVVAGTSVAWYYSGLIFGDLGSGILSQAWKSRRKAVALCLGLTLTAMLSYVYTPNLTARQIYWICLALGLGTGYWAVFVTMASEQFGTNLRATVTTTAPNFVRGALPLLILIYRPLRIHLGIDAATLVVGGGTLLLAFLSLFGLRETHGRDLDFIEQ